jgi:membrane-bound lytic murein transglycosylase F
VRRVTTTAAVALTLELREPQPALQQIRSRGELRVVMLNAPTSYYLGAQGPQGLEYRLVSAFAQQLGVKLVVQAVADTAAVRAASTARPRRHGGGQISSRSQMGSIGESTDTYQDLVQLVVQGRGRARPRDVTALRGAQRGGTGQQSAAAMLLRSIEINGGTGSDLDRSAAGQGRSAQTGDRRRRGLRHHGRE